MKGVKVMPDLSQMLPVLSIAIAAFALYRNLKGDTKQDAGQMMEVIVKLETINENVKEVKADMKDVKSDVERMKERLITVEQSAKAAHKRIDTLHHESEAEP